MRDLREALTQHPSSHGEIHAGQSGGVWRVVYVTHAHESRVMTGLSAADAHRNAADLRARGYRARAEEMPLI